MLQDLANALIKHRQLIQSAKSTLNNDQVQASTLELVRLLKARLPWGVTWQL